MTEKAKRVAALKRMAVKMEETIELAEAYYDNMSDWATEQAMALYAEYIVHLEDLKAVFLNDASMISEEAE